jgi:phenylacetate-CoA ligase
LERIWPNLLDYDPDFIYAYPSTAITLCQFLERSNKTLSEGIKAILVGSENVYEGQDKYIERISGKRVFRWYGHSEKLVLAGECEKSKYYHAFPQYGYVEFINENGEPARPGEFAEIVGTGFINTVVPFIRYRTGDYCTYLGERCPECGRNYPIFSDVRGRWTQEVLYGRHGNSICMSAINMHSDYFKNVFRYQFYQDTPGEALLKIMPRRGFSEKDKTAILKEFNDKFDGNVVVKATIVEDIPLTQRGKYKFIDQNISEAPRGWPRGASF